MAVPLVRSIRFNAGAVPGGAPLTVSPPVVTIFVGPNNCGKSTALREIEELSAGGRRKDGVVAGVDLTIPTSESDMDDFLRPHLVGTDSKNLTFAGGGRLSRQSIYQHLTNPSHLAAQLAQAFRLRLDGRTRLSLTDPQASGDLLAPPTNNLMSLFRSEERREALRRYAYEAFDRYFVIDPTNIGQLRVRLARRPPDTPAEEQGWDDLSRRFHAAAPLIDVFSDGVRAYIGLLVAVMASHRKIVMIDEPEAFLHPPLARRLGSVLARVANETGKQLFVATHSASYLLGTVESGVSTTVVRLTYDQSAATARCLPSASLTELLRDPLLRSTSAISGLFHEAVVVTESEADRALYDEVNVRLQRFDPQNSLPDALFLHAQNCQTVHRIVRPLRLLGIPAAAIVDVDVLEQGGKNWKALLTAAAVPSALYPSLEAERAEVHRRLCALGQDWKTAGGISLLSSTDREAALALLRRLADYGVFVVPYGALESWLRSLGVPGHGPPWLVEILSKMGSDPEDSAYLRPTSGDVWTFVTHVSQWISQKERHGIPTGE